MNNVVLIGRLTRDVEMVYTNNGSSVGKFGLAVDRKYKREGEPTADFINCVSFGKTAEFIEKWFHKGSKIAITGHIQTGSYTNKDGVKVYTTDIIVDSAEFVESNNGNGGGQAQAATDGDGFASVPDNMDELPFA